MIRHALNMIGDLLDHNRHQCGFRERPSLEIRLELMCTHNQRMTQSQKLVPLPLWS